eukprot:502120_1
MYKYEMKEQEEKHDLLTEVKNEIKFKKIFEFAREIDFYNYVCGFLTNTGGTEKTLVIVCDAVNAMNEVTHYLHAEYLTEQARRAVIRALESETNNNKNIYPKNIVFLIHMTREKPYPLIFNRTWKHLFLDALLPADHPRFLQIQISDINIFDAKDQATLHDRLQQYTERMIRNNVLVETHVSVDADMSVSCSIQPDIERILLANENKEGKINRVMLVEQLQKIFTKIKNDTISISDKRETIRKLLGVFDVKDIVIEVLQ